MHLILKGIARLSLLYLALDVATRCSTHLPNLNMLTLICTLVATNPPNLILPIIQILCYIHTHVATRIKYLLKTV